METPKEQIKKFLEFVEHSGKSESLITLFGFCLHFALIFLEDHLKIYVWGNFTMSILTVIPLIILILLYRMHGNLKRSYTKLVLDLERKAVKQNKFRPTAHTEFLVGDQKKANGTTEKMRLWDTALVDIENIGDERAEDLVLKVFLVKDGERTLIPSFWVDLVSYDGGKSKEVIEKKSSGAACSILRGESRTLAIANFKTAVGWTRLGTLTSDFSCLCTPDHSPDPNNADRYVFFRHDSGESEAVWDLPANLEIAILSSGQEQFFHVFLDRNGGAPRIDPLNPEVKTRTSSPI